MSPNDCLPDDPDALRALARRLRVQLEQRETELRRREAELRRKEEDLQSEQARARFFERELRKLERSMFGRRSERLPDEVPGQLSLLDPQALPALDPEPKPRDGTPAKPAPARKGGGGRGRGGRKCIPPHIERVEVTSTDDGPTTCACCGGDLHVIGEDRSERLEYVPGHFVALVTVRKKRACKACPSEGVVTQPAPPFGLQRSKFADGFVAKVLVDKYADNIPLRRQVKRFEREGLEVAIASLCRIAIGSAELLKHVVAVIADELRQGAFLQGDGTGLPILDGPRNDRIAGALWVYTDGEQAVFEASRTHEGRHAAAFLHGFEGVFLPDGASTYNEACRPETIARAGCWAHARRKFFDARHGHPRAFAALQKIKELFLLEREAWQLDAEGRHRLRRERAKPWLKDFKAWVDAELPAAEPRGAWHGALQYVVNQWDRLIVFVDEPAVPIHNNASERALRGPVTGRKNWLFAGSEGGADAAAVHFTIVHCCMLAGIDPFDYLRDVLHRLPDATPARLKQLTPRAWAARAPADEGE